jgi:hypothetical protein
VFELEQQAVSVAVAQGKKFKWTCDLDRNLEVKMQKIEDDYNKTAVKNVKAHIKKGRLPQHDDKIPKVPFHYNVYAGVCSDPVKIRKHLDSGILAKLLAGARRSCAQPTTVTATLMATTSSCLVHAACLSDASCQSPLCL